jgi:hypothetical protein
MCGRLRVGKRFLHVCSIGRCSHVSGLSARHTGPLAIMPSADQVPIKSSHSMMLWPKWVVLIARSTGSGLRAVRPSQLFTSRRVAGTVSFTPPRRRVPGNARLLSSWPRPFVPAYWRAQWPRPYMAAAPAVPWTFSTESTLSGLLVRRGTCRPATLHGGWPYAAIPRCLGRKAARNKRCRSYVPSPKQKVRPEPLVEWRKSVPAR